MLANISESDPFRLGPCVHIVYIYDRKALAGCDEALVQ